MVGTTYSPSNCFVDGYDAAAKERDQIIEKLVEALEFYADRSSWVSRTGKVGICPIDTTDREITNDEYPFAGGKLARSALAMPELKAWRESK